MDPIEIRIQKGIEQIIIAEVGEDKALDITYVDEEDAIEAMEAILRIINRLS